MRFSLLLLTVIYSFTVKAQLVINKTYDVGVGPMLHLSKDSIFYYAGVGCYESWVSKGKWYVQNDSLILNSYDSIACKPTYNIVCLECRKEDSFITMHYFAQYGRIVFYSNKLISETWEYLTCDRSGKLLIPINKYTHFEIEGTDTTKYLIPKTDFSIYCDYPSFMVDRSIKHFSLGKKVYYIKRDGLYDAITDRFPAYPFPH